VKETAEGVRAGNLDMGINSQLTLLGMHYGQILSEVQGR
jgi:hypothetical protein